MNSNSGLTNGKKLIIVSMMSAIIIMLAIVAFIMAFDKDTSRTIMIYMSGHDLETNGGFASTDMDAINPNLVNLEKTNVLVYTGGSKKWHNYVSSDENAIYQLTPEGYKKIQTYERSNMGDPNNLTTFLNYCYDNFQTDRYDLIMWNHGAGSKGTISDEYTRDMLLLYEVSEGLENSRFSNKKLETIIFRTCLNGSLEMASTLSPYADYMVASEEVTMGASGLNVLGFINNVNEKDDGKAFGEKFIKAYQDQMSKMSELSFESFDSTYSIIRLNKIPELLNKMDTFFGKINVSNNYNEIARIRSTMHQYAKDTCDVDDYDTVDLYELFDNLKIYSSNDAENLKNYLKNDVILTNWATNIHSNGLSVYFPYNGGNAEKSAYLKIYDKITASNEYKKFIKEFNSNQTNSSYSFAFNLTDKEIKSDGKEFKMKLTKEEQDNFTKANYMIFKKENDGFYTPVYVGKDAKLDKKGYLTTNLKNNLIAFVNEVDNTKEFFTIMQIESNSKNKEYTTSIMLEKIDPNLDLKDWKFDNGNAHIIVDKKDNAYLDKIYLITKEEDGTISTGGAIADINSYTHIAVPYFRYKILDENGNYTSNWESSSTKYMFEAPIDKYHFETSSLDEGDYYCVFVIYDAQNKPYYSNLIKIN